MTHTISLHVENHQGVLARIAGLFSGRAYNLESLTVGVTADEAKALGYEVITGRFPMAANGRTLTLDALEGFAQVVAEKENEVLLGVTLVGPQADSLIGEAALALEMGATLTDLVETLHPHPSLGETIMESAEAALGLAVHIKQPEM